MKKVILLTIVMILAIASISYAYVLPNTGPRITYGGLVQGYVNQGVPFVVVDTLICVFNPNNFVINNVGIAAFDKYGLKVADTLLLDGGLPITSIPAKGWAWQTIGHIVPLGEVLGPATKYTFVVYWTKPTSTPNRGLVIEIKEIIYTTAVPAGEVWYNFGLVKNLSEAAIGKGGTGFSGN